MNSQRNLDLNRVLDAFLGEGPAQAPDRMIAAALERVDVTRQRRRPVVVLPPMFRSRSVQLGLVATLLLAGLAAGALFLGSRHPVPSPLPGPSESLASAGPSAVPSRTPAIAPAPRPTMSVPRLVAGALNRQTAAIEAARPPGGPLTLEDQNLLFQRQDDISVYLDNGDVPSARKAFAGLSAAVDAVIGKLDPAQAAELASTTATVQIVLFATPFNAGELSASAHYSRVFFPTVVVSLPAGWTLMIEDRDVLAVTKGSLTLAFDREAADATKNNLFRATWLASLGDPLVPASPVTLGRFSGFWTLVHGQQGYLWITEAKVVHEAGPDSEIAAWLVNVTGSGLTIHLDGPAADVQAALPEVLAILDTLEST